MTMVGTKGNNIFICLNRVAHIDEGPVCVNIKTCINSWSRILNTQHKNLYVP